MTKPRDLFNGPRDEFWAVDPATGKPLRVHPGPVVAKVQEQGRVEPMERVCR